MASVVLGAWALRLAYFASIHHAFFFTHLGTEPLRYHQWACAILDGQAPFRPPFDEAPAYPYLVAAVYGLVGRHVAGVALLQGFLDALACGAIALVGARLGDPRRGLLRAGLAGGLAAFYGPSIYFSGELLPATLMGLAVAVALLATPHAEATGRRWIAVGALWSLAVLVRSELAVALPLLLFHAGLIQGRRALVRAALVPLLFLGASLGLNHVTTGRWVLLTTGSGVNLFIGNHARADGVNPFIHGPLEVVVGEVAASARDPVEADERFRAEAFAAVRANPGRTLRLLGRKLLWTFTNRELPNTSDIDWQLAQSWLFHRPLFPLPFAALFPLALVGAVLLGRSWRRHVVLAAPLGIAIVVCAVFFTNARFRLVMVVSLIPLAAFALSEARWQKRRSLVVAAFAGVAGLLLAVANVDGVHDYRVPQILVNTGQLERAAGRPAQALAHLEAAVRLDADDPVGWIQLALALEDVGRSDDAARTWGLARDRFRDDPMVREGAREFFGRR